MGRRAGAELGGNENFMSTDRGGVVLTNDNADARRVIEQCYKRHKTAVNPIIDWTDAEVWEFIRSNGIPYCSLYDEGFHRLGCIGCPMARQKGRERDFMRWPKYKEAYLRAFAKMLIEREKKGKLDATLRMGATPTDVFNWWMEYDVLPGQMTFDDYED
jgi:phosphoadenosine phosphosulfate reductase